MFNLSLSGEGLVPENGKESNAVLQRAGLTRIICKLLEKLMK